MPKNKVKIHTCYRLINNLLLKSRFKLEDWWWREGISCIFLWFPPANHKQVLCACVSTVSPATGPVLPGTNPNLLSCTRQSDCRISKIPLQAGCWIPALTEPRLCRRPPLSHSNKRHSCPCTCRHGGSAHGTFIRARRDRHGASDASGSLEDSLKEASQCRSSRMNFNRYRKAAIRPARRGTPCASASSPNERKSLPELKWLLICVGGGGVHESGEVSPGFCDERDTEGNSLQLRFCHFLSCSAGLEAYFMQTEQTDFCTPWATTS